MTSPLIGISTFICTTTLDLAQLLVECAGSLDLHVDLDSSLDLGGRLNTGTCVEHCLCESRGSS